MELKKIVREPREGPSLEGGISHICVDGSQIGGRYLLKINDEEVPLTAKSFRYFTMLAYYRRREEGWVDKEELELGDSQSKNIYRMKREIGDSCPIIENNKLGAYRLGVDPEIIAFNEEKMRENHDAEVSRLFS